MSQIILIEKDKANMHNIWSKIVTAFLASFAIALLTACDKPSDEHVFTLYSSHQSNRIHVATFDVSPKSWNDAALDKKWLELFSNDNFFICNKAASFFQNDWDTTVKASEIKYWCEKGRYRK